MRSWTCATAAKRRIAKNSSERLCIIFGEQTTTQQGFAELYSFTLGPVSDATRAHVLVYGPFLNRQNCFF